MTNTTPSVKHARMAHLTPYLHIREEGVQKLFAGIDPSKASGPEMRSPAGSSENLPLSWLLYSLACSDNLTGDLITQSWLTAWIASVFKKGPQCKHGNYRPVSFTCVMCKLMEHIICTHICSHLDRHGILSDLNHGFRSRHSCESQLLITTHDFLARMDQREEVDVLVLDFSKVFDTGQHKRLLKKFYGIHGELLSRIRAFLSTRTQSVEVKGWHSPEDKVLPAVPQGTVLGPLLFLCHINDLPSIVDPQMAVRLFVDDCLVYRSITSSSDHRQLQPDLPALSHWGRMLADEVQCG